MSPEQVQKGDIEQLEQLSQNLMQEIEKKSVDKTGAKREVLFHADLARVINQFVTFEKSPGGIKASLKKEVLEQAKQVGILSVSAKDLGRINKVGGHAAGDAMLQEAVKITQEALHQNSLEENSEIYHLSNADFATIIFANNNNLEESAKDARAFLETQGYITKNDKFPGKFSSSFLTLEQTVDFFNNYGVSKTSDNEALLLKDFIGKTIKLLEHQREAEKLTSMVYDFKQMYTEPTTQAREYFDKYIGLYLKGTPEGEFEKFFDTINADQTLEEFGLVAAEISAARVFGDEHPTSSIWKYISKDVVGLSNDLDEIRQSLLSKPLSTKETIPIRKSSESEEINFYQNKRAAYLVDLQNKIDALTYLGQNKVLNSEQIITISYLAKLVQQEIDITPETRQKLEEATKVLQSKPDEQMYTRIKQLVFLADKMKVNFLSEFDPLTGLPNKEKFNQTLEEWENMEKRKNNITLVSLDLGFLKYFNIMSGRNTGNLAILKAGWILEQTAQELGTQGYEVKVFRTGGDEFSLLIYKTDAISSLTVETTLKTIDSVSHTKNERFGSNYGEISAGPNAKETYATQELSFDAGASFISHSKFLLYQYLSDPKYNPYPREETEDLKFMLLYENDNFVRQPQDQERYTKLMASEQGQIFKNRLNKIFINMADATAEIQKTKRRFEIIFHKFESTLQTEGELADYSQRPPENYLKWNQLYDLLAYSGKTMEAKGLLEFKKIHAWMLEKFGTSNLDTLTQEQLNHVVKEFYGSGYENEAITRKTHNDLINILSQVK